jgi:hypothetical protein
MPINLISRIVVILSFWFAAAPALAQNNFPTPGGATAPGMVTMCNNGSGLYVPCAPGGATFPISSFGAKCDGVTDDTAAIQAAVTAWKAASTGTTTGISVLVGMGNGNRCKITSPLDFTRPNQAGPLGSVVRDLYVYAAFTGNTRNPTPMSLPIGTWNITAPGTGGTNGTYPGIALTNVSSSGTGCSVNVTVAGGAVTYVQDANPGGCGTNYKYGDTFTVTAGGITASLNVATLSGGAAIDAMASKFIQWQNVVVEGDCTNPPNVGWAWGRAQQNAQADSHSWFSPATFGCFQFAAAYNLASEVNAYFHPVFTNSLPANGKGNCYVFVGDGSNHFNWSTIGAGVTWSTPVDTLESFTENQFFNARFTIPADQNCPATTWLSNAKHLRFFGSYMLNFNVGVILWQNDSVSANEDVQFDMRLETPTTSTTLNACFLIAGMIPNITLNQIYYDDNTSNCDFGGAPAVFKADVAGAGGVAGGAATINSVTFQGLTVKIARFPQNTPVLFDQPAIYSGSAALIQLPSAANWNGPSQFTVASLCLGNICAPVTTICASSVAIPLTGSTTETNLATCQVPPMLANSCLRVRTAWSMTGNTDSKTPRVRYNTAAGIAGAIFMSAATSTATNISGVFETMWCNQNSTGAQKNYGQSSGLLGFGAAAAATSAISTTAPTFINFTGLLGTSTDTLSLENYAVELLQKP